MSNRPRIVHLISSLKMGGAEKVLCALVSQLASSFDQTVIYFHDGPLVAELKKLNIPVYQVQGAIARYDPIFIYRLISTLRKNKPTIVHSSLWAANFFGVLVCRFLRIPIVCSLHTVRDHEGLVRNQLDRFSLPYAQKIIAVSNSVIQSVEKTKLILPAKLALVPNGIDINNFLEKAQDSPVTLSDLSLDAEHFIIGAVGRFVKVKKFDLLLDAVAPLMRTYPRIRLVLVGIGPEFHALKIRSQQLGILPKVRFIVGEPAYLYYKLFNCFVQPSEFEGLSLALLEALCLKLPCIVTGKNKHHEIIIPDRHGLIVAPNNVPELKSALKLLYQDRLEQSKLSTRLGRAGFDLVRDHYELDSMVNKYKAIFQSSIR